MKRSVLKSGWWGKIKRYKPNIGTYLNKAIGISIPLIELTYKKLIMTAAAERITAAIANVLALLA